MSGSRGVRSQLYVFKKKSTEKVKKIQDFGGSVVKNPPANAGGTGSITGLGRSSEGGNGNPLQYSCLENSRDRGAWQVVWKFPELRVKDMNNLITIVYNIDKYI